MNRVALLWDMCEVECDRGCVDEWMCDVERSLLHHCVCMYR